MMLLRPLEKMTGQLGGEAGGVLVKDLLCGEALSPNTHCPTRVAGLLNDDCSIAPLWFGTRRLSPFNPIRGSSFLSKIGEKHSPRSVHQHKSPFCSDEFATAIPTARRDPPLRREPAGHSAALVADLISIPRPTLVELGEAMRVLQEREAQMAYRLTDRYVNVLMESDIAQSSFSEVRTVRRDGVFHVFKLVEALRLRNLIAAHAIAYLDRFLNSPTVPTLVNMAANPAPTDKIKLASSLDFNLERFRVLCESPPLLTMECCPTGWRNFANPIDPVRCYSLCVDCSEDGRHRSPVLSFP